MICDKKGFAMVYTKKLPWCNDIMLPWIQQKTKARFATPPPPFNSITCHVLAIKKSIKPYVLCCYPHFMPTPIRPYPYQIPQAKTQIDAWAETNNAIISKNSYFLKKKPLKDG